MAEREALDKEPTAAEFAEHEEFACERGEFPRPIKIGDVNLWVREEVEQLLDERAARVGLLAGAAPR